MQHSSEFPEHRRTVVLDEYDRELPTRLTADEVAERADLAARTKEELNREADALTALKSASKARTDRLSETLNASLKEVGSREALCVVSCQKQLWSDQRLVAHVRTDTGELIGDPRRATGAELQIHLLDTKRHQKPPRSQGEILGDIVDRSAGDDEKDPEPETSDETEQPTKDEPTADEEPDQETS